MSPTLLPNLRLRTLVFISVCTALVATVLIFNRHQKAAGNIVVNSTSDIANASDGLCTLREAITAANTNLAEMVKAFISSSEYRQRFGP